MYLHVKHEWLKHISLLSHDCSSLLTGCPWVGPINLGLSASACLRAMCFIITHTPYTHARVLSGCDNECLLRCSTDACGAHRHLAPVFATAKCRPRHHPALTAPHPSLAHPLPLPTRLTRHCIGTRLGHLWALKKPWNMAPWQITSSIFFSRAAQGGGWWVISHILSLNLISGSILHVTAAITYFKAL